MPVIDLNVDFSDVQDEDVFQPLPPGTYSFRVQAIEQATSKAGRPMLKWTYAIVHEGKEHKLSYYTVLPWMVDGKIETGGVGMLVSATKAVGIPWTGQQLVTEDYLGAEGTMEVVQKPKQVKDPETGKYVDDPDSDLKVNDIKKFVY